MNLWIFLARLAILATFLILAAGGPWAIISLRIFIRRYTVAHKALQEDHTALKARVDGLEHRVEELEHKWTSQ